MVKICRLAVLMTGAALFSMSGSAQSNSVNALAGVSRYSPGELAQHAKALAAKCRESGKGSCSEVLEDHPTYTLILGYRDKDGGAELHKYAADVDMVLDGTCTLITGGTIEDAKTAGKGEVRGRAVLGGDKITLQKGDIVQVPANTPHQMLLPNGATLTYFVIKPKQAAQ